MFTSLLESILMRTDSNKSLLQLICIIFIFSSSIYFANLNALKNILNIDILLILITGDLIILLISPLFLQTEMTVFFL